MDDLKRVPSLWESSVAWLCPPDTQEKNVLTGRRRVMRDQMCREVAALVARQLVLAGLVARRLVEAARAARQLEVPARRLEVAAQVARQPGVVDRAVRLAAPQQQWAIPIPPRD